MSFPLSEENLEIRRRVRNIAETVVRPIAAELDRSGEYPWPMIEAMKKENLMGIWVPKEYGGLGAGILNFCIAVEELSRACGGVGVAFAVNALGSMPILIGGTEDQKRKWLPRIAKGEALAAFGLTEKEAGSDAGSLQTSAAKEDDGYVIEGEKKWTTGAGVADIFTIFAKTSPEKGTRGISGFLVERNNPQFEVGKREDLMGIRCVPVHEIHLKKTRVSEDALLGGREGAGFAVAMMTLDRARPGVAAQACGLAQGAFELACDYAQKRKQFGQPIGAFQGLQFMLSDMAVQVEAARNLIYNCAGTIDSKGKKVSRLSAMAKLFATDTAMKVTVDAVQIFGGYGYSHEYPIEKYMRDAKITQIYEGTNQIQRLVIGRSLVKEGPQTPV